METPTSAPNPGKTRWWDVALFGRCPACGGGPIFKSLLSLKDACPHCSLPLQPYQQADGPAFFALLIVGTVMMPVTLWLLSKDINILLAMALLGLLMAILVLGSLRLIKGVLITAQYKTGAREGRLDNDTP